MGGTEIAIAAIIMAAAATTYSVTEQKKARKEARSLADEAYQAQLADYEEKHQFLSELSEDPTKSSIWPKYSANLEAQRSAAEMKTKDLFRRKGDTGGPLNRALTDLQAKYEKDVETNIYSIRNQAEMDLANMTRPVRGGGYTPVDLSGIYKMTSGAAGLGGYMMGLETKNKFKTAGAESVSTDDRLAGWDASQFRMLPEGWETSTTQPTLEELLAMQ